MAKKASNDQIFADLAAYLNDLGLGSLFSTGPDGSPAGWLWNQITQGFDTESELIVRLEDTKAFKERYAVITEMRQRAAAGEPVQVPSVADVREYEQTAATLMRQAGLPPWFYDSYKDAQKLMSKGVSPRELEQRIATGWTTVRDIDPSIRKAFSDFYGVAQGDAALAAFVLDPSTTMTNLERASRAAYTAGYGRNMGLDVNKQLAERVAALPQSEAGIQQGLSEAARYSGVYTEGITETEDITSQTGIEATLLGSGDAQGKIEKRILERQAQGKSSQGGAAQTQQGLVGLRNA